MAFKYPNLDKLNNNGSVLFTNKTIENSDKFASHIEKYIQGQIYQETVRDIIRKIIHSDKIIDNKIKSIIYEKEIINKLFDDIILKNKIRDAIDNFERRFRNSIVEDMKMQATLIAKNEASEYMKKELTNNIDCYLFKNLENIVEKHVRTLLPNIIYNNSEMKNMFNKKRNDMENKMTIYVNNILDNITSDEKYHEINQKYFDYFRNQGLKEIDKFANQRMQLINNFENKTKQSLSKFENDSTSTIKKSQKQINDIIKNNNDNIDNLIDDKIKELDNKINNANNKISNLEKENNNLKNILIFSVIGCGLGIIGSYVSLKYW